MPSTEALTWAKHKVWHSNIRCLSAATVPTPSESGARGLRRVRSWSSVGGVPGALVAKASSEMFTIPAAFSLSISADVHTTVRTSPAHNDGLSLAIAHHAGVSQMTGTRNDFSATRLWAHHPGMLKSVGNATSGLINTSCLCHKWAFLCSTACTQKRQCGRSHTQA